MKEQINGGTRRYRWGWVFPILENVYSILYKNAPIKTKITCWLYIVFATLCLAYPPVVFFTAYEVLSSSFLGSTDRLAEWLANFIPAVALVEPGNVTAYWSPQRLQVARHIMSLGWAISTIYLLVNGLLLFSQPIELWRAVSTGVDKYTRRQLLVVSLISLLVAYSIVVPTWLLKTGSDWQYILKLWAIGGGFSCGAPALMVFVMLLFMKLVERKAA